MGLLTVPRNHGIGGEDLPTITVYLENRMQDDVWMLYIYFHGIPLSSLYGLSLRNQCYFTFGGRNRGEMVKTFFISLVHMFFCTRMHPIFLTNFCRRLYFKAATCNKSCLYKRRRPEGFSEGKKNRMCREET